MDATTSLVTQLFRRGRTHSIRVGVEHELVARDVTGAAVALDWIRAVARTSSYAPFLGFEPGGQVELSLPAAPDSRRAGAGLVAAVTALRRDCARIGVRLTSESTDPRPFSEIPLQLTSARYVAMQQHFDSVGPAGRRMMRGTASTQICLDWWPGAAGLEQWRLLQLAGPFLAAAYARSTGPGSRLATWLDVDPGRTAFDDRLLHGDPVAAYVDFARAAVDFLGEGPSAHLTTLFPAVRPRGHYLEVRFLDAQPEEDVAGIGSALASLMYDDALRSQAIARLAPAGRSLGAQWQAAAAGESWVADVGRDLLRTARALVGVA